MPSHTVFTLSDLKGEFSQHRDLFLKYTAEDRERFSHLIHGSLISHPFVYLHFAIVWYASNSVHHPKIMLQSDWLHQFQFFVFVQLQEDLCNSFWDWPPKSLQCVCDGTDVLHPWFISQQYLLLRLQLKLLSKLDFWRTKWGTTPKYWSQVSFVLEIPLMSWKSDESLLYFITSWCLKALLDSLKRARVCFFSREVSSHYCWHVASFWLDLRRQNTMA